MPKRAFIFSRRLFLVAGLLCLPGALRAAVAGGTRTIVFFGDSLTAGYGLEDPAGEAYPALIAKKIAAAGLPWRVVNAGVSGETSADGLRRVDWILRQPVSLFVLALGGNDGLRGIDPAVTKANLQGIVDRVRAGAPQARIVLAGMTMPPSLGADYVRRFTEVYPDLAKKNGLVFMPFLLEGVAGDPALNQADGIHPTSRGHEIIAKNLWAVLQPLL